LKLKQLPHRFLQQLFKHDPSFETLTTKTKKTFHNSKPLYHI